MDTTSLQIEVGSPVIIMVKEMMPARVDVVGVYVDTTTVIPTLLKELGLLIEFEMPVFDESTYDRVGAFVGINVGVPVGERVGAFVGASEVGAMVVGTLVGERVVGGRTLS